MKGFGIWEISYIQLSVCAGEMWSWVDEDSFVTWGAMAFWICRDKTLCSVLPLKSPSTGCSLLIDHDSTLLYGLHKLFSV